MATRLRHIAIIVPDPEAAAKFFEQAFDMKRAGTARRGIYMSDGVINVALLKQERRREARPLSFRHVGRRSRRSREEGGRRRRHLSRRPADLAEFLLRGEVQGSRSASCSTSPTRAGSAPPRTWWPRSPCREVSDAAKPDRVIVIGAGPVGLCLALALAQQGVRSCLIEALGDDNFLEQVPRAGTNHPATLEMFDRIGLYAEDRAARHHRAGVPLLGPRRTTR